MENIELRKMAERWASTVVARGELGKFSGGIINPRTAANWDSQGIGIPDRMRSGRKIFYPVESIIRFLEARTEAVKPKQEAVKS